MFCPQEVITRATQTIYKIAQITEDKMMYDSREKAIRDKQWELKASFREGEAKGKIEGEIKGKVQGKIELIRTLEGILGLPHTNEYNLLAMDLDGLQRIAEDLQERARGRNSS